MGRDTQRIAHAVRNVLSGLLVGAAVSTLAGACGEATHKKHPVMVIEGCLADADCVAPLICAFQRCHERCESSHECPDGERCVLNGDAGPVCQLDVETVCEEDSDCEGEQHCAVDAECRDVCDAADECVEGQKCSRGSCADDDELTEGGELPIEPGHEPVTGSAGHSGD